MAVRTAESPYVCGWETTGDCSAKLEAAFESGDSAVVEAAQRCLNSAAEILYALSGRQFGLCESTIRPCRRTCSGSGDGPRWTPVLSGGQWYNVSCGNCPMDSCSCTNVCEVQLPGVVHDIVNIMLDGVEVPAEEYRVDNRKRLVRLGGECWPTCQDMNLESTEVGTWEVTYTHGKPLPESGKQALAVFAGELYLGCRGDDCCALPSRVTTVSREGVSFAMLDPMAFLDMGKTGLYMVDLWLKAVNPNARSRGAAILSPDMPQQRKTTWP